jgi:sugar-specific transcriptional regulator TrmB
MELRINMELDRIYKSLKYLNLNKNESKIYIDLIKHGRSSVIDISRRTKIHRTNVYELLRKLAQKETVNYGTENHKKVFYPVDPKDLLEHFKQREYSITKTVEQLGTIQNKPSVQRKLTMFDGVRQLRVVLNNLLDSKKSIFAYGVPKEATEVLGGFAHDFHKRRIDKKILLKYIYNKNADKRIRELNKLDYTEARYLPSLFDSEMTTYVCCNKVILVFWEYPVTTIIIENESIANSYRNYFKILWEESKIRYH